MSALMNLPDNRSGTRRQLLATASVAAILVIATAGNACAADSSDPMVWLNFTGQLDQLGDKQAVWVPDYYVTGLASPLAGDFNSIQKTPKVGYDADLGFVFQPGGSAWNFSASVRVGRARQPKELTKAAHILPTFWSRYPSNYGASSHSTESHLFVDFAVGKDVGIGIFGADSTISAGVRIANMRSRKDVQITSNFHVTFDGEAANRADSRIWHEFHGVGPAIAWKAFVPVAGNVEDGQLDFDWGLNASLLFGRQKTKQTTHGSYFQRTDQNGPIINTTQTPHSTNMREKKVTVPGLGGFAGVSLQWSQAKISLGYRADFYFGAIDGGLATPQRENREFYGPFASISIGISPSDF